MSRTPLFPSFTLPAARALRRLGRALLVAALASWPAATALAATAGQDPAAAVELEVFVREGCPHCADAKVFLEKLRAEEPRLAVTIRDVWRDPAALERLQALVAATPGAGAAVPAFHANGRLLIGFVDEATSAPKIRALIAAPAGAAGSEAGVIDLPWIGRRVSLDDVGLPLFTVAIGLLDGFNPCSMWVLILMISMLAAVGDRRRMVAIAGTFVIVQGVAYFVFMAAWLNLFLLIGLSRASEIVLGVIALVAGLINVKDFVAFGRGVTLSIPASAKPGIYQRIRRLMNERSLAMAIGGTIVLGMLVQVVELVCTSGLPALYTRILTQRQLDPMTYYGYLLLYNLMYMVDDVMVLAIGVVTLSRHRLQEKEGRVLKLVSGLVMLGLGIYLIAFPG
ncbi:MAG: hypothetical protein NDI88_13205 [Lysobacter sp.]|nr:hypothetical protein [Lysobacter sp.]